MLRALRQIFSGFFMFYNLFYEVLREETKAKYEKRGKYLLNWTSLLCDNWFIVSTKMYVAGYSEKGIK